MLISSTSVGRSSTLIVLLMGSCTAVDVRLRVDLVTDLVPGIEFHSVRTVFGEGNDHLRPAYSTDSAAEGMQVADFRTKPKTAELLVELLDGNREIVAQWRALTALNETRAVTAYIGRSCVGVTCEEDEACFAGRCESAACLGDTDCEPQVQCEDDSSCPDSPVGCATPRCIASQCFNISEGCGESEYCDVRQGCQFLPGVEQAANIVFVTSTRHVPADVGSLEAGDAICAERAAEGGLEGRFLAFLASSLTSPAERFTDSRGWVRPDGKPVADTFESLMADEMFYPIRLDENGDDVGSGSSILAMTGINATGQLGANCDDYSTTTGQIQTGSPHYTAPGALKQAASTCADAYRIYCFEVGKEVEVSPIAVAGPVAFVSTEAFLVTPDGIQAADDTCQREARSAGLSGEFLALIPPGDRPAFSRFDSEGERWVRVDGVPVAESRLAFANDDSETSLNVTATGQYIACNAWGAESLTEVHQDSCNGWTDQSAEGARGECNATGISLHRVVVGPLCNSGTYHLYCLQQ